MSVIPRTMWGSLRISSAHWALSESYLTIFWSAFMSSLHTRVPIGNSLNLLSQQFDYGDVRLFMSSPPPVSTTSCTSRRTELLRVYLLSPVIARFFMEDWVTWQSAGDLQAHALVSLCGWRILIGTHRPKELNNFLNQLNSIHPNIQIPMESESNGHPPFLDIDIYRRSDGSFSQTVTTRRHNPEDLNLNLHSCENLKCRYLLYWLRYPGSSKICKNFKGLWPYLCQCKGWQSTCRLLLWSAISGKGTPGNLRVQRPLPPYWLLGADSMHPGCVRRLHASETLRSSHLNIVKTYHQEFKQNA